MKHLIIKSLLSVLLFGCATSVVAAEHVVTDVEILNFAAVCKQAFDQVQKDPDFKQVLAMANSEMASLENTRRNGRKPFILGKKLDSRLSKIMQKGKRQLDQAALWDFCKDETQCDGDIKKELQELRSDGVKFEEQNENGYTALLIAAEWGQENIVKSLVEDYHVNVLATAGGKSAAQLARKMGYTALADYLQKKIDEQKNAVQTVAPATKNKKKKNKNKKDTTKQSTIAKQVVAAQIPSISAEEKTRIDALRAQKQAEKAAEEQAYKKALAQERERQAQEAERATKEAAEKKAAEEKLAREQHERELQARQTAVLSAAQKQVTDQPVFPSEFPQPTTAAAACAPVTKTADMQSDEQAAAKKERIERDKKTFDEQLERARKATAAKEAAKAKATTERWQALQALCWGASTGNEVMVEAILPKYSDVINTPVYDSYGNVMTVMDLATMRSHMNIVNRLGAHGAQSITQALSSSATSLKNQ